MKYNPDLPKKKVKLPRCLNCQKKPGCSKGSSDPFCGQKCAADWARSHVSDTHHFCSGTGQWETEYMECCRCNPALLGLQ